MPDASGINWANIIQLFIVSAIGGLMLWNTSRVKRADAATAATIEAAAINTKNAELAIQRQALIDSMALESVATNNRLGDTRVALAEMAGELKVANLKIAGLETRAKSYDSEIDALKKRIGELQEQIEALKAELQIKKTEATASDKENAELRARIAELEAERDARKEGKP